MSVSTDTSTKESTQRLPKDSFSEAIKQVIDTVKAKRENQRERDKSIAAALRPKFEDRVAKDFPRLCAEYTITFYVYCYTNPSASFSFNRGSFRFQVDAVDGAIGRGYTVSAYYDAGSGAMDQVQTELSSCQPEQQLLEMFSTGRYD